MGRKKLPMRKVENHSGRVMRYSKRRDGMVKKASEISILCDAEVGLLMFSPTGRLTSFATNGRLFLDHDLHVCYLSFDADAFQYGFSRIEDVILRYIECPDNLLGGRVENEEYLIERLKHLNFEHEMLDKIAKMKDLEEKLQELTVQKVKAQEKMRAYNPDANRITSIRDAQALEQILVEAIQRGEQLKEKLLNNAEAPQEHETIKVLDTNVKDVDLDVEVSANASSLRNSSRVEGRSDEASSLIGPHLSIDFLKKQKHWNLQGGGNSSMA